MNVEAEELEFFNSIFVLSIAERVSILNRFRLKVFISTTKETILSTSAFECGKVNIMMAKVATFLKKDTSSKFLYLYQKSSSDSFKSFSLSLESK